LGFPFWPDAAGKFRIGSPWQWQSGSHLEAIWINQNQSKSINRRLAEKYGSNLDPLGRVILRENQTRAPVSKTAVTLSQGAY
jgi:hypothetical protein